MRKEMITFFFNVESRISFTTDIWTSPNDLAFMAITAHWICPDFKMHSVLMDFVELNCSHSGVNIEKAFSSSLKEFKVFEKKLAITLDNAYNNDTFLSALMERDPTFDKEHHIRCFGHVLNLCAQDALKMVESELSCVRNYLKAIVHKPKRLMQLEEDFKEAGGQNFIKPVLDVKTRWNSTFHMIKTAFRLKDGLSITMESIYNEANSRKKRKIAKSEACNVKEFVPCTDEDWNQLSTIMDMLKPLNDATTLLSGDTYPSLNMVVPAYTTILDHLERIASVDIEDFTLYDEEDSNVDAAKAAFNKLNKYYDISSELCSIATVLDPRLKLEFYRSDSSQMAENPNVISSFVKSFYEKDYAPDASVFQPPLQPENEFLNHFYTFRTPSAAQNSEYDLYIAEPVMPHSPQFSVLDYWRTSSGRFPNLSRMAGTSTPSERAFSAGRQLITDFRCRLAGDTITACMLLKSWLLVQDMVSSNNKNV